jgi:hypothetical protein
MSSWIRWPEQMQVFEASVSRPSSLRASRLEHCLGIVDAVDIKADMVQHFEMHASETNLTSRSSGHSLEPGIGTRR